MTPEFLTAAAGVLVSLLASVVVPGVRDKRRDRRSVDSELTRGDANLRDDQREFITVLQSENRTWRAEVAQLHQALDALRADMEKLRTELATERRARESAEGRYLELLERRKQQGEGSRDL